MIQVKLQYVKFENFQEFRAKPGQVTSILWRIVYYLVIFPQYTAKEYFIEVIPKNVHVLSN